MTKTNWTVVLAILLGATLPTLFMSYARAEQGPVPARFRVADTDFKARRDERRAREALTLYRQAFSESPSDAGAGWRLAMACYFVGIRLTPREEDRRALYREGRDAGLRSIEADPHCAPCQFWTAINMALYGDSVGVFKMLFTLGEIQDHLQRSLQIDPTYAYSGAYRLLGLIKQKLPGILGGSNDQARHYFELAIKTSPDEPLNYLFMVKLLRDELSDRDAARKYTIEGASLPAPSPDRLESIEALRELKSGLVQSTRRN